MPRFKYFRKHIECGAAGYLWPLPVGSTAFRYTVLWGIQNSK